MKLIRILNELTDSTKLPVKETLNDPNYTAFVNWIIRFQQQKTDLISTIGVDVSKNFDVVPKNKTYTAYRGIFIKSPNASIKKLKVGDIIPDESTSWSTDIMVAKQFARDDHHAFGGKTRWNPGKSIGIIMSYEFRSNDVLFDLEYMDSKGFTEIKFPKEKEIIVPKITRNCKITNILFNPIIAGKPSWKLAGI